jgi:hypothetical protein
MAFAMYPGLTLGAMARDPGARLDDEQKTDVSAEHDRPANGPAP